MIFYIVQCYKFRIFCHSVYNDTFSGTTYLVLSYNGYGCNVYKTRQNTPLYHYKAGVHMQSLFWILFLELPTDNFWRQKCTHILKKSTVKILITVSTHGVHITLKNFFIICIQHLVITFNYQIQVKEKKQPHTNLLVLVH